MELFNPVEGAGEEEILDLIAAVVGDQCAPIFVLTKTRVFMFVEGAAIKTGQGKGILGEVARCPVKQYANAILVAIVDKKAELIWRAKTAGGGVVASGLVAPGAIKRMFSNG